MSPAFRYFSWITLQMLLALIGLHSERVTAQFHPYISEFQYVPEYHPSRNPRCASQWLEFYEGRSEDKIHRHSPFEEQIVDQHHPWIEIRAVLGSHCTKKRKEGGKMFHRQLIRDCQKKVIISMKINNVGKTNTREEFVLVDHVLDPVKMHKIRLRNPYVIKVRQEPLLHLYGLRFQGVVNAEAREEVINNHRMNFTGCNDGLDNPTCGKMLINGEPIPFSHGFCCSCEDVAGSPRSTVAKSNHYQPDEARNRSDSGTDLFDNPKAQRQTVVNGNEGGSRAGLENGDMLGQVTCHDRSVVNGPLGPRASPFRKHHQDQHLTDNSARQSNRPHEEFAATQNEQSSMQTPSPMLRSLFSGSMPSKKKIEAFIDTVYEQAMKERSMKESVRRDEDNQRNEDPSDDRDRARQFSEPSTASRESNSRINGERCPICGTHADHSRRANVTLTNAQGDRYPDVSKSGSRTSSPQFRARSPTDDRYLIHGSVTDNQGQSAIAALTELKNERDLAQVNDKEDSRPKFLEPGKCDGSGNLLQRKNREKQARGRLYSVARFENSSGYTPTLFAIHLSRIPEGNQAPHGSNALSELPLPDNASTEFFASSGVAFASGANKASNYAVTPGPNGFAGDTSTESRYREFRTSRSISSNVDAPRDASAGWRSSAIWERKAGNANASTRIPSTVPLSTRLRNLSPPVRILALEELSALTAAAAAATARPRDRSSSGILEPGTPSSLLADEIQGPSDDLDNLYANREPRGIYNPPEQTGDVKSIHKFGKRHQKPRKSKDAAGFYKGKNTGRSVKHFGKSLSAGELISKRASPDRKRDGFQKESSKREKRFRGRFRRHLRTGRRTFNPTQRDELDNADSQRKTQAFIDYHAQPQMAHFKRKMSENRKDGNPTRQVILEPGQSYRKVQSGESDDPLNFGDEGGKQSDIDKRIEDRFVRISKVLQEDSTEPGIIQRAAESLDAVAKSKDAKSDSDSLEIPNGLKDDLFSRASGRFNGSSVTRDDGGTQEDSARLIDPRQRSATSDNATTESTMIISEIVTASSAMTWENKQGEFALHESQGRLSGSIIGPFLSRPITRKPKDGVSKKASSTVKSTNPIYRGVATKKRTGFLMQEPPANANDYSGITGAPLGTLSSSWSASERVTTSPVVLNNRKLDERDGRTGNARFLHQFNNDSLRMIAGDSARPRDPSIAPGLSLRDGGSITEPRASASGNESGEPARYTEDPLAENLRDVPASEGSSGNPMCSRQKDEIAELVDRIVRQYAAYTPIMPGMPTFDEITEAETLPAEAETSVTELTSTTAVATTTKITDEAFRGSIRPLETTPLPGSEIHEEVSLDETTFAEETEATRTTTTNRSTTTAKWKSQAERSDAKSASPGETRRVSKKTEKSGKPKQKVTGCVSVSSTRLLDAEGETEAHPWYRTTEVQQIIAANRSRTGRKTEEGKRRRQRYESTVEYFGDSPSSDWLSSTMASTGVTDEVAPTRSKRADLIGESGDRASPVFHDHEEGDEGDRRSGKTARNKSEESSDMVPEPNGLRPGIEKRLAGELDYPANRQSSRRGCGSEEGTRGRDVALGNIAARDLGFRAVDDGRRADGRDTPGGGLKNLTALKLHRAKGYREHLPRGNRHGTISILIDSTASARPALPADLSGSMYGEIEVAGKTEGDTKRYVGEHVEARIDKIVAVRKIAVDLSANARSRSAAMEDLSSRIAELATSRISLESIRSLRDEDKAHKPDAVIRAAKLMTANDKGEITRDPDVAVKNIDGTTIVPSFATAKRSRRKDAGKINENAMDVRVHRVSMGEEYTRRPRDNLRDTIRKMIGKLYRGKSSSTSADQSIVRSEESVERAPMDWHRSGRRLLSNGQYSYAEETGDEYYEDEEERETRSGENNSASDSNAIARSEDLSAFGNRLGLHEDRDRRKLAVETQRSVGENNDAAAATMPREKIIAVRDTAIIPDDVQAVNEETISSDYRNSEKNRNTDSEGSLHDIDTVPESTNASSFNNDNILEASVEEEKSTAGSAAGNISVRKKSSGDSDNGLRSRKEVDEEPLWFREEMNEDNLADESLQGQSTVATYNTGEATEHPIDQDLSSTGQGSRNDIDTALTSAMLTRNEGSVKISLSGRIQVNGASNQTPMLISFDAIPEEAPTTRSPASAGCSNVMLAIETTVIDLPLNNSNAELAFDLPAVTNRVNDKTNDSLDTIYDESREIDQANANEVAIKSRGKFFDLARGNGKMERKAAKEASSRIEKRLDRSNVNLRTAKQVFLTDYSRPPIAERQSARMNRTSAGRTIPERNDDSEMPNLRKDKLDFRSSVNSVRFPDVLGSVLVNNDSLRDQDAVQGCGCRIGAPAIAANRSDSKTDRSSKTALRVIPLVHIKIEKSHLGLARDENNRTSCCPEDSRNSISGGCYRMPTTIEKLPGTVKLTSPATSSYQASDSATTSQAGDRDTTTRDRITETTESSESTKFKDLLEVATEYATSKTLPSAAPCNCDESVNAIRIRNMMAIVRFMMKLLRITDDEESSSCRSAQTGETMIRVESILVNASTGGNGVGKQRNHTADNTTTTSERDLTSVEGRSTVTEVIHDESLPLDQSTSESFTEAPPHSAASTLPTTSSQVFKDEKLSASALETSTERAVYAGALSNATSSPKTTPKSFLFYKPERKSLRENVASRKGVSAELADVKQSSNISFNDSKKDSKGRGSRLDSSQRKRSSSRAPHQDRSPVDRLRAGKQESAATADPKRDNMEPGYLARNKSAGFRWSRLADVASNGSIAPMHPGDTPISRDALLDDIAAIRGDTRRSKRKEARKARKASDRRVKRTKLLNSSPRSGFSRDWIGKRQTATRQLQLDKKRRESREAGTATLEKVLFQRGRNKINLPPDPNLGIGRDDSFKMDVHAASSAAAKHFTDDALSSSVNGGLNSSEGADSFEETNVDLYSPIFSSLADNVRTSRNGEGSTDKRSSAINKKRNVKHREAGHRDVRKDSRVSRKRHEDVSPTWAKMKWRKKKKKKKIKGGQRAKDTLQAGNQRRFKRRLMMLLEPEESEYDADGWTRRYIAEDFRESAKGNAKRTEDGSRIVTGPEVDSNRAQIRGGQDCTDRRHPPNIDTAKYLESAHCLRFSDLWYSVYRLEDPIVEHTVHLQVYEKRLLANGSTYWADLTGDSVVRLGTFNRRHRGSGDTIAFAYKEVKTPSWREEEGQAPNLDVTRDRLLVPSSVTSKGSGYPIQDESDEYLVVPASSIGADGNECDKAGVGFAAFARQPDRCGRVRGTCLKNQPLAYRKHDTEARAAGRPGCYFLSNFASVPSEAIKYSMNGSGSREFLALEYHSPHVSAIDIEVRPGYNAALAAGSSACISEVHIDNTVLDHTVITVTMVNTGSTLASYQSEVVQCPDDLPESWVNATFPKKMIQPRQNQAISLDLYGELPKNEFHCSVRSLNRFGEPVASRRIKVRKMDRCSCVLHCQCVCVGDVRGETCRPMSAEFYHDTGCRDFLPMKASHEIFSRTAVDVLLFIALLILLLIFMGFLKCSIGLYVPTVSRWGLDFLLGNSGMSQYYERELKCKCVVTDVDGAPVHPDTRKRTVRICSRKVEFFLNAIFFLIFPLAVCCYRLKQFCRPAGRRASSIGSKISLTSGSVEHPRTVCVSTYGQDSQGSRMEAEDTKYIMDELKKSEESLRSYSRNKVSGNNKETDNGNKNEQRKSVDNVDHGNKV